MYFHFPFVIGACSLCGGDVVSDYSGPRCSKCGARKKQPVIEMEPQPLPVPIAPQPQQPYVQPPFNPWPKYEPPVRWEYVPSTTSGIFMN